MIKSGTINLLAFPQQWEPPVLTLNVLILPKGDPFAMAPPFPTCTLQLEAACTRGLEALPTAAAVALRKPLAFAVPGNRPALFAELADRIPVRAQAPGIVPDPPLRVKKAVVSSYIDATGNGRSRTSFLVSGDEYDCALRDSDAAKPKPAGPPPDDFYWEEIYGFVLRQPILACELGLVVLNTSVDVEDGEFFRQGGFVYADLAAGSDYAALPRAMFAARIPPIAGGRRVFTPVLFPVDDPGNFDHVTPEAVSYDDGFAKLVHGMQPRIAAVVESSRSKLPPVKDIGIRLGWDDEQVAVWLNRQFGVNAYDPGSPAPGAPLGVAGYRVDVFDDDAGEWRSLTRAEADLVLGDIPVDRFDDELWVETLPVNINNDPLGEFWLPSFFTTWAGGSLVVTDRTPYEIAGHPEILTNEQYTAVGADVVPLRYGRTYQFRVRLADLTGGGPRADETPRNPARTPVATIPFRRYSPPKAVRAVRTDDADPGARTAQIRVFRPMLGYPDIVFTDFPNAVNVLAAQAVAAENEQREPMLPDPDATQVRIDLEVRSLARDPEGQDTTAQPFVHVLSFTRDFPEDPAQPLELDFEFTDVPTLTAFRAIPGADGDPILLPSARAVRLVFTAIGADRADYWGTPGARDGAAPVSLYVKAPSLDERFLISQPAFGPQIQGIFLQPDAEVTNVSNAALAMAGLRNEAPADLTSRLAAALDVPHTGLTFSAPAGMRLVFGASTGLRHTLNPDGSSMTFAAKSDLTRQWLVALRFSIERDWTWSALGAPAFEVRRDGVPVGMIQLPNILGDAALSNGDCNRTQVVYIDSFDPKPGPPPDFPKEIIRTYSLHPLYLTPPEQTDEPYEWPLRLPITTPPRQTPKVLSAGWAFSPYSADERYSSTGERKRMLYLQLDGPPEHEHDQYVARVLACSPDPMLIEQGQLLPDPLEPPLAISREEIRVITQGQSNDFAGRNAMDPLVETDRTRSYYLLPLPKDMPEDAPELFGFFVYELRVAHEQWCTEQGIYGPPLRLAGVQHPAPPLRNIVARSGQAVSVLSPYAGATLNGRNLRAKNPRTQMHSLLYAQVHQADGKSWRNVLIGRSLGAPLPPSNDLEDSRLLPALMRFSQDEILATLRLLGLPLNSPLSVVSVETLPEELQPDRGFVPLVADSLGSRLGQVRILRTSVLTPVPEICPPKTAV